MKNLINILEMNINDILLLIIISLIGIILVFGIYFSIIFYKSKKNHLKVNKVINPKNLVEEESLLNVLNKKKNINYPNTPKKDNNKFLNYADDEIKKKTETSKKETTINPFKINFTQNDNQQPKDSIKKNKFF